MTRRVLLLLLAAGVLMPGTQTLAATKGAPKPTPPRVAALNYYGFSVGGTPSLSWNGAGPGVGTVAGEGGLGAVQFPIRASDTALSAVVSDAAGERAGGGLYFIDSTGRAMGTAVEFCGKVPRTKVPVRAANARVYLDPTICPGPITKGTVKATIAQRQPRRR